jgi:D-alanyl-D-alanine carboxypeptidase
LVASVLPEARVPVPTWNPARTIDSQPVIVAEAVGDTTPGEQASSPEAIDPISTASTHEGEWIIQIGSMPSEAAARAVLSRAAGKAPKLLGDATAFTESIRKDGNVYYRARYGGFDTKSEAWRTCDRLARENMDCYALIQSADS